VSLDDIAVGSTFTFQYPQDHDPCILVRPEPGVLLAFSQTCTHLSCPVIPDAKDNVIHCPCHHGVFDLASGRPLAGPPRRPLERIQLEVRQGIVYATGIQRRTQ
ncbi:MAG: Rieske (2Fe-2S) protein, partial [Tepidisphaeraceae bacterium]